MTRRSLIGSLALAIPANAVPGRSPRSRALRIAVVNKTSRPAVDQTMLDAVQKQLDEQFFPAWGMTAELYVTSVANGNEISCLLLDETDAPGELGYHGVDTAGLPYAKVFLGTCARFQQEESVVLSHEILEMLANRWTNAGVLFESGQCTGALYSIEVCDPVQAYTYKVDGVSVSNFVLPAYYQKSGRPPYDYLQIVKAPFTTAPAGTQPMKLVSWS